MDTQDNLKANCALLLRLVNEAGPSKSNASPALEREAEDRYWCLQEEVAAQLAVPMERFRGGEAADDSAIEDDLSSNKKKRKKEKGRGDAGE